MHENKRKVTCHVQTLLLAHGSHYAQHGQTFLARVAREMFESVRELETPALGSRATLCADSLVPLPRQRSMGTCRQKTAKAG